MIFKHYLNFVTLPEIGRIEIGEPIGFDKSSYKVKQSDSRFGRDIVIANEDTELIFTREYFEQLSTIQTLPSGEIIDYASQGFDFLLDIFENEGTQGEVEYIISKDGIDFTTGIFSYFTMVVQLDQIKVKIIQNTARETIKRLEDTDVDAFSTISLDNRTITPCTTTNILLKAKPIHQVSEWDMPEPIHLNFDTASANGAQRVLKYGIDNTLSWLDVVRDYSDPFRLVYAKNDLSDIVIEITNLSLVWGYETDPQGSMRLWVSYGIDLGVSTNVVLDYKHYGENFNSTYTLNIPFVPRGASIWVYFRGAGGAIDMQYNSMNTKISCDSTAVDTVVKGVRLYDLIKHNVQSLADVNLIAPDYDVNGEHYNEFCFNGFLLGQITDKPFYNKWKDLSNVFDETCSDVQINTNSVEVHHYNEYYKDIELATFEELPSYESETQINKRYSLKTAEFNYKNSATNRETSGENTIDDVHTQTQKYLTDKVDGNLKIELDHIRSAFLIEEARQRAFDNKQTNSLQNDDKLFVLDCTDLAPNSKGHYNGVLAMQWSDTSNTLKILNNDLEGNGIFFNWNLLGFKVGDTIYITQGQNIGSWNVITLEPTVITLTPNVVTSAHYSGDSYVYIEWFFTDVLLTNVTNQGFDLIQGVENPQDYANLNYHWQRNIQRWYPYLATSSKYIYNSDPTSKIKTASFKNNGNLITRKFGETVNVIDKYDIPTIDISSYKILNPVIHSVKVYAEFEKLTQLIADIRDLKGYVTVKLNSGQMLKGFVKELDYVWRSEELTMDLEEKFETDYLEITNTYIKEVGYDKIIYADSEKNYLESFKISNIYVNLFNPFSERLINKPTRFNKILLNGVVYTDKIAFADALQTLIDSI